MLQGKVFNNPGYFIINQTKLSWKAKGNQIIPKFAAQHK